MTIKTEKTMERNSIFLITIGLAAALLFSGCAVFLLGAGAAGGYAISKDEIEGLIDAKYDKVWSAAKSVLREDGVITLEDKDHGRMDALIEKSDVETRVEQATTKTVRLRIKARKTKGLFPNVKLAQGLYTKILKKAE